jgi:hypothetical protein
MEQLARQLMGLGQATQFVGQTREVDSAAWDWPEPPRLKRSWYAAVESDDRWHADALQRSLGSIGLRAQTIEDAPEPDRGTHHKLSMCLDRDGYWCSTLVLRRWPREVAPGWLGHALDRGLLADMAIHVAPRDAQRVARYLRKQQTWQTNANAERPDAANELGRADAERVRRELVAGTDRPLRVAVAITVRAHTPAELRDSVATARHELGLTLADVRQALFESDRGLKATTLSARCGLLGAWRTLNCVSVASTWLYQPGVVCHAGGADLGVSNGMLVRLDPFDPSLESFGGLVLAKVGAGKSFLLKLIASRLSDVEAFIVEQRLPPEYTNVAGAVSLSLGDLESDDERVSRLGEFIEQLWTQAKADPRPRILILDELWSLIREPRLARRVEEIARMGRHYYLSLWIATQQVRELLLSAPAVLDNAAIRIYLKQHDNDLDKLVEAVGLTTPQRRFLRTATRGEALLDVGGMIVPLSVQATPAEHRAFTTDPRERLAA